MSLFIIACGGTGGHLSPGISLAETLIERGHKVTLLVSRKKIDARLLEKYPHLNFERAPGAGFSKTPLGLLKFVFSQIHAVAFAAMFVLRRRPDVYLSFGGFLTFGMAVVCRLCRIPVVLHEANRVPGRAVRLLSGISTRVYLPPSVKIGGLPPLAVRHAGFPVRKEIRPVPRAEARANTHMPAEGRMLLILGGSQGASSLNAWVEGALDKFAAAGVSVLCVTGPGKGDGHVEERTSPSGAKVVFRFIPFCDRMADALSGADLVVSRAGAGSIAEFTACSLPSILIPYPFAADNHQEENARFFELQGGGFVVRNEKMDTLTAEVLRVIGDDDMLARFRANLVIMNETHDWHAMTGDLIELAGADAGTPSARVGEGRPA
jgi:UDP-N-acetylglucosamine--N-acetylmuramyl-(pentapeptide) pyrophosphoryl-undecaprenol N-acetylglucosamine transferase